MATIDTMRVYLARRPGRPGSIYILGEYKGVICGIRGSYIREETALRDYAELLHPGNLTMRGGEIEWARTVRWEQLGNIERAIPITDAFLERLHEIEQYIAIPSPPGY